MTASLFLLIQLSALLHASWNALLKREADPKVATLGVITVSVIASWAVALLRGGGYGTQAAFLLALAAGLCEAGYFLSLGRALSFAPLGRVYAIARGGGVLLIWPLSLIFLGETLTWTRAVGAVVVILGIFAHAHRQTPGTDVDVRQSHGKAVLWAIATGVTIALYNLLYKASLNAGAEPSILFATSVTIALPLNIWFGEHRLGALSRLLRQRWVMLSVTGLVCTLSFWLFLYALEQGGAGLMLSLRNTSVVFALLLGIVMGERPGRWQWLGSAAIIFGALLLAV